MAPQATWHRAPHLTSQLGALLQPMLASSPAVTEHGPFSLLHPNWQPAPHVAEHGPDCRQAMLHRSAQTAVQPDVRSQATWHMAAAPQSKLHAALPTQTH